MYQHFLIMTNELNRKRRRKKKRKLNAFDMFKWKDGKK